MVAAILVTAFGSGELSTLFSLVLGFTISTTALSYAFIFISYIVLRYKYPEVERPYWVPGGMVGPWIVTLLALASVLLTAYFTLVPTDETVSGYQISRLTYELTQLLPIAIVLVVAVIFYLWGRIEQQRSTLGSVSGELVTDEAAPSANQ
jgi:amino acid transporter